MAAIKTLGSSGQVSLIPDSERWLQEPEVKAKVEQGLAWAERTPRQETDLAELEERLRIGTRANPAGSQ
jgi:hypothetical protein